MTKKEKFINFIEKIFNNSDIYSESYPDDWSDIVSYWETYKSRKTSSSDELTENGLTILTFMQDNMETTNNAFTAKDIADGIGVSGRAVGGSMRKLVKDGFVDKSDDKSTTEYSLTDKGISYNK